MCWFLENNKNLIVQVFSEFYIFLFLVHYDCNDNKMLHNALLDSKKIHIRSLCDFFSNSKKKKDDLIYKDFIISDVDLSVSEPVKVRTFINKSTAHISRKRGQMKFPEEEFLVVTKALIRSINSFIREMDYHLNLDYSEEYYDQEVQQMKSNILWQIVAIVLDNAKKGIVIEL